MRMASVLGAVVLAAGWAVGQEPKAGESKSTAPARPGELTVDDLMGWRKAEWTDGGINYTVQARAGRQVRQAGGQTRYFVQVEFQNQKQTWIKLHPADAVAFADFCDKPAAGLPPAPKRDESKPDDGKGEGVLTFRTLSGADQFDPRVTFWLDYDLMAGKFDKNRAAGETFSFDPKAYSEAVRAALKDVDALKSKIEKNDKK